QLFGTPAAEQEVIAVQQATPVFVAQDTSAEEEVLAESVSLSEEVVVYEAEPVAVAVEEPVREEESKKENVAIEEPAIEETGTSSDLATVIDMEETPYGVALYSNHISTSTGGIPAS